MIPVETKDFASPDEVRTFEKGRIELLNFTIGVVGRLVLEPGWKWSIHVKSIPETEWCEEHHFLYQVSGVFHILMQDGAEYETRQGQVVLLPYEHDAWVVGDEPVILVDWWGATSYAKKE